MIIASDGVVLDMKNLSKSWHYDESGKVDYYEVQLNLISYRQTLTRDNSGNVIKVSRWEIEGYVPPQLSGFSSGFSYGFGN